MNIAYSICYSKMLDWPQFILRANCAPKSTIMPKITGFAGYGL
jgi:hypothetical protein